MSLPFSFSSELLYGFLMKQFSVMLTAQIQRVCTSYVTNYTVPTVMTSPTVNTSVTEQDERELDLLQMDKLLKWMELVFDDSFMPCSHGTKRAYKQELFNIYRTLCSDYQQYRRWKEYNQSIWLFSSYRRRDTKSLSRKLLSDIRLFKEGLQLYTILDRKGLKTDTTYTTDTTDTTDTIEE